MRSLRIDAALGHLAIGTPSEAAISMARNATDTNALKGVLLTLASDNVARQREAKLPELLAHYDIAQQPDGSHWKRLALALASDHVEGFKVARTKLPTGAVRDAALGFRIELLRRRVEPHATVAWACRALPKEFPQYSRQTQKAVRNAHSRWKAGGQQALAASLSVSSLEALVDFFAENGF
jgi:hypothetical protein